jgi:hypothetical protein
VYVFSLRWDDIQLEVHFCLLLLTLKKEINYAYATTVLPLLGNGSVVIAPRGTNATVALQQKNGVFYEAEKL